MARGAFTIMEVSSYGVVKYAIDKLFKRKIIIVPTLLMKLTLFFNCFSTYFLSLYIAYKCKSESNGTRNSSICVRNFQIIFYLTIIFNRFIIQDIFERR